MENKTDFDKLREANNKLRLRMALLIKNLKAKEQEQLFKIVNQICNNEVEQEKLCNN